MSKMGQAILEMQEDAVRMTREEFAKKHGKLNVDFYDSLWDDLESEFRNSCGDEDE